MARFAPEAQWGPYIYGTRKGTIRHLSPPATSVELSHQRARARWLVFPRWGAASTLRLEKVSRTETFLQVASNAFNYEMQGHDGFTTVRALVDSTDGYFLDYSNLDEAVAAMNGLADSDAG